MNPPPPRSERNPVWEKPQLWRNRIDNVPLRDAQHTEPEFGPVRTIDCPSQFVEPASCFDQPRILLTGSQDSQDRVVHGSPIDGTVPFDMQAPPTIFVLSCQQVVLDLDLIFWWNRCAGCVPANDQTGEEEKWSAILAGPVSWRELECRVEGQAVVNRLGGLRRGRQVRKVLSLSALIPQDYQYALLSVTQGDICLPSFVAMLRSPCRSSGNARCGARIHPKASIESDQSSG